MTDPSPTPDIPQGYTIAALREFLNTTALVGPELARALASYTIRLNRPELDEIIDCTVRVTKAKSNIAIKPAVRTIFNETRAAFYQLTIEKNRPKGGDPAKASYEKVREIYAMCRTMPGQVIDLRGDRDSAILNMRSRDLDEYASNTVASCRIGSGGQLISETFYDKWVQDADRREFERMVIDKPGIAPPNCYNLFKSYAIEPKEGSCDTIKEYLLNTLCCDVIENYDYLYQWICFKIQHPGQRTEVLVQVVGGQGTGKTTLFALLKAIFGRLVALLFDDPNAVDQAFNSQVAFKAITAYDEAFYSQSGKARNKIKGMITGEDVNINKKGVPQYRHENHQGIVIFTNAGAGVGLDPDDRRQFVLRASTEHANDKAYFNKVYAAIDGAELQAFLYDALSAETPERLPVPPKTNARRDAIAETARPVEDFIHHLLDSGESHWFSFPIISKDDKKAALKTTQFNPWPFGAIAVDRENLHQQYREYMAGHHKREGLLTERQLIHSIIIWD